MSNMEYHGQPGAHETYTLGGLGVGGLGAQPARREPGVGDMEYEQPARREAYVSGGLGAQPARREPSVGDMECMQPAWHERHEIDAHAMGAQPATGAQPARRQPGVGDMGYSHPARREAPLAHGFTQGLLAQGPTQGGGACGMEDDLQPAARDDGAMGATRPAAARDMGMQRGLAQGACEMDAQPTARAMQLPAAAAAEPAQHAQRAQQAHHIQQVQQAQRAQDHEAACGDAAMREGGNRGAAAMREGENMGAAAMQEGGNRGARASVGGVQQCTSSGTTATCTVASGAAVDAAGIAHMSVSRPVRSEATS